ncbi:hypothetical protein MPSEU_000428800 [Mayamaea pseudoterrestris]|nr:hypothetical protein MPSEU_000428800 [Mayamaea pseudoterrestris]
MSGNQNEEFPAPPRMPPISNSILIDAGKQRQQSPKSGVAPHLSTTSIPPLASAPPSGNFTGNLLNTTHDVGSTFPSVSPTIVSLPPPPPPARLSSASPSSSLPRSPLRQPSTTPLPPPPVISTNMASFGDHTAMNSLAGGSPPMDNTDFSSDHDTVSEPPRLPCTSFAPKTLQLLAKRQTHIPVLVLATEAAHKIAWKNQLRLTDMLEGLIQSATSSNSAAAASNPLPPFRSTTRSLQLNWSEIQISFIEPDQLAAPLPDGHAQTLLQQHAVLQSSDGNLQHELQILEDQVDNLLQDNVQDQSNVSDPMDWYTDRQEQLQQVTKDAYALTSPLSIPWLWRYRMALDASTDGLEPDMFQCPALCLLVCTTNEVAGPLETLKSLSSRHYLPPAYQNGLFDPDAIRKEVLVLHDSVDGPAGWSENSLRPHEASLRQSLQAKFGPSASIVRLNSIAPASAAQLAHEEDSDLWGGDGARGKCLSVSDRVVIRKYLAAMVTNALLPALERRVADLNAIVSDRKKGVKNVLKSFWRGGSRVKDDEVAASPSRSDVRYRFDSIESQSRLLADTLFLMRDYDAAQGFYRLVKDDYKQDKAHGHYGSVLEQIALCMYLADSYGRAKDIFASVESALLSYSRASEDERPPSWGEKPGRPLTATPYTRLATRLCLVLTATRNICDDKHVEVGDLLASASSHETSLGAAVLLEQSSAHYFRAGMYRKYAFHMLMSGHMFRSAEQEHHAFRCFTSALYIYRYSKWDELHNHLRSALAAQLYSMDRLAMSLQLYAKLVGSSSGGRVSSKSQQKFVNHLLEICNDNPKKALVGADRMASSPKLSGEKREAVRKERLERIVQVVRYTKSASRVLEIPNMTLPCIDNSTVIVIADETYHSRREDIQSLGTPGPGTDDIWNELTMMANAELRMTGMESPNFDESMATALARIDDPYVQNYLSQIDKEKLRLRSLIRSKKSSSYIESPPVRARREPITVDFAMSNPLSVPIDLSDLQLIVRMSLDAGEHICTNEDAIKITPLVSYNEKPEWTFPGSDAKYAVADFCRTSSGESEDGKHSWRSSEGFNPSFVVTKTSLTLDPESRKSVAISICPLTEGRLEILGARCRLFDDVWVNHVFDLPGDLLQDTRSNRASRVRGKCTALIANVERGMPSLTVQLLRLKSNPFQESPETFLDGEVSHWTLRVSNVGTAAATNVFLKTNLPWISITGASSGFSAESDGLEHGDISNYIGPTGTLMKIPLHKSALRTNDELLPEDSVDIPIQIMTTGNGKQSFYLLFRYELVDDDSETPRYRWLRSMFEVPVLPSLRMDVHVAPLFSAPGKYTLSVEATNLRTDRPDCMRININKLSLASRCYSVESLGGHIAPIEMESSCDWQEKNALHVLVSPTRNETVLISECQLSGYNGAIQVLNAASTEVLDFVRLHYAHDICEQALRSHESTLNQTSSTTDKDGSHPKSIAQIRRENTSSSFSFNQESDSDAGIGHPTSLKRLCPPEQYNHSFSLVMSWSTKDGLHCGQHFKRDICIRPSVKYTECPISLSAIYPESVVADLNCGPAYIPYEITLHNGLVDETVPFEFTIKCPEDFDIVGPECFKGCLGGGDAMSFELQAIIPHTGLFNLQRWIVHVHSS